MSDFWNDYFDGAHAENDNDTERARTDGPLCPECGEPMVAIWNCEQVGDTITEIFMGYDCAYHKATEPVTIKSDIPF